MIVNPDPIEWDESPAQSDAFNALCLFEVTLSRLCLAFGNTEFDWGDAHQFAEAYGKETSKRRRQRR